MAETQPVPTPSQPIQAPAATGPGPGTIMYADPTKAPPCATPEAKKAADAAGGATVPDVAGTPSTGPSAVPADAAPNPVERKMRSTWNAEPERIRLKILLAAPAARVWRALVEPAELTRWFCATAKIEKKKGGAFAVGWTPGKSADWTIAKFEDGASLSVARPEAMEFTLTAESQKSTLLEVVAELPGDLERSAAEQILWSVHLVYLKAYLENGVDLRENDRSRTRKEGYVNGAEPA